MRRSLPRIFLTIALASAASLNADEGLWLFNQFPKQLVARKYRFQVTDAFLDHLRLSSVRFKDGSGSFISPNGLLFTNHHIASDCIQALSSAEHDYMADGFFARTEAEEQKCPNFEADVLLRIQDVTAQVKGSAQPEAAVPQANQQRKAAMSRIEKECTARTSNRCEVVTLYSGGEYNLYEYKKYNDIRLVFAPEADIAAFGGDPDNFSYPRYCLDFAFLRAYENGRPAGVKEYLRWSREGVQDGELIFVSGNPGATERLATMAALEFFRDVSYPLIQARFASLVRALEEFGAGNTEDKRVARENLLMAQNSYKAYTGILMGLRDPDLTSRKKREEDNLRAAVKADPAKRKEYGNAWAEIAAAYQRYRAFYKPYALLERYATRGSGLFRIARDVVRYAEETGKPDSERLRDFADANLPAIEQEMYSPAPVTDSMETAVLAGYFTFLEKEMGADDAAVKAVLHGRTPREAAREYVSTSKLKDIAERKRLAGNVEAVRTSQDGMIRLARILDEPARRLRKQYDDQVEAVLDPHAAKIAQARFAVYGASAYPDATFTLRLTYGPVEGYRLKNGDREPYTTAFAGLYRRATGKDPYKLPPRWIEGEPSLSLATPFNFVSTADTHGGNSGSPTVNERNEIVGILFDGNIESLPNQFVYTEAQARSVHVASQAIIEALRKIYHADRVLDEAGMDQ